MVQPFIPGQPQQSRQGDVFLLPVSALPEGIKEVSPETWGADKTRIVLAHGEVTGHAHAIYDEDSQSVILEHETSVEPGQLATDAIKKAMTAARKTAESRTRAKLWQTEQGVRYLQVLHPVALSHDEHQYHGLAEGFYKLPVQVEHAEDFARRVAD